jgi:hypothetical protein
MARGRMISKALSTSQKFAQVFEVCPKLAEFAQSLYPLLVAHSDDHGRQQGDAFTVKHQVHPASPRNLADFEKALTALHDTHLIVRYQAGGRAYVQIVQFDEHQSGLHKRRASSIPEPPGNSGKVQEPAVLVREIPAQEKRTELKGTEEKGTEEERGAAAPSPSALVALWNELTSPPIPKCESLTPKRVTHARARLKERALEAWAAIIRRIEASSFCRGGNDRGWRATFDWLLQPDTSVKVLEGKFDDYINGKARPRSLGPDYSNTVDWFEECKELHGGGCEQSTHHRQRMQREALNKAAG